MDDDNDLLYKFCKLNTINHVEDYDGISIILPNENDDDKFDVIDKHYSINFGLTIKRLKYDSFEWNKKYTINKFKNEEVYITTEKEYLDDLEREVILIIWTYHPNFESINKTYINKTDSVGEKLRRIHYRYNKNNYIHDKNLLIYIPPKNEKYVLLEESFKFIKNGLYLYKNFQKITFIFPSIYKDRTLLYFKKNKCYIVYDKKFHFYFEELKERLKTYKFQIIFKKIYKNYLIYGRYLYAYKIKFKKIKNSCFC